MITEVKIPQLKTNPKYKDAPRYPMIYKYEGELKDNYSTVAKVMLTELTQKMISYVKES